MADSNKKRKQTKKQQSRMIRVVIFSQPSSFTSTHRKPTKGKKAASHSVYELHSPGLEAVHLKAALHPLIGAHNGLVLVSPVFLQRPTFCFN